MGGSPADLDLTVARADEYMTSMPGDVVGILEEGWSGMGCVPRPGTPVHIVSGSQAHVR